MNRNIKSHLILIKISTIYYFMIINVKADQFDGEFCSHNYIDAVLYDGSKYMIYRNQFLADYYELNNTVGLFYPQINALINDLFDDWAMERGSNFYYQSMFNITIIPEFNSTQNNKKSINLEKLRYLKGFKFTFTYDKWGDQNLIYDNLMFFIRPFYEQINNSDKYVCVNFRKVDHSFMLQYGDAIPDFYVSCKSQTHKPSTYWPNKYMLIYVFNGNSNVINSSQAIIATKYLTTNQWEYHYISGSEHLLYTALFWWKNTDTVYAVIENKNDSQRNGFVFKFDDTNLQNPFIVTNQTIVKFFGCKKQETNTTTASKKDNNLIKNVTKYLIIIVLIIAFIVCVGIIITILLVNLRKRFKMEPKYTKELDDSLSESYTESSTSFQPIHSETTISLNNSGKPTKYTTKSKTKSLFN